MLCNDAHPGPAGTDGALLTAAAAAGIDVVALRAALPRTHQVPFDSVRREMRTWHATRDGEIEIAKGAPEALLPRLAGTAAASAVVERWAAQAWRVLTVTAGPPGAPVLLGLPALADPVRPEAREAVRAARAAGIRTIMITGDHPGTATAVARATGVLADDDPPPDSTDALRSFYARTDPGGKLDIVADWQRAGHVVAMTGDGVNDAPALRAADVGVAMGRRGTEVTKEAADLVLTDDSLATVVAAVAEGRRVFDNIRRFARLRALRRPGRDPCDAHGSRLCPPTAAAPRADPLGQSRHPWPAWRGDRRRTSRAQCAEKGTPPTSGGHAHPAGGTGSARAGNHGGGKLPGTCPVGRHAGPPVADHAVRHAALAQLGIAVTTRSDRCAVWRMSPAGNPFLYTAVGLSAAGLLAATYLPGLRDLLDTTPLSPSELGLSLAIGALPAVLIETTKAVQQARLLTSAPGTSPGPMGSTDPVSSSGGRGA